MSFRPNAILVHCESLALKGQVMPPKKIWIAVLVCTVLAGLAVPVASAAPNQSRIERVVAEGPTRSAAYVYSAAMRKTIKVQILTPSSQTRTAATTSRPTLYMLGGLGEEDPNNSIWLLKTDIVKFFANKNVNVVLPIAGNGSFYTDWRHDDPVLGRYRWETFLTRELPPLLAERFGANGSRAIAGLSMGAGSALVLAARHPRFYRSAASFSGCYSASDVAGQISARSIINGFGGNADNMWGPIGDPDWAAHDVVRQAAGLRGTDVYVSVGSGLPGRYDAPGYPGNDNPADRVVVGGAIEIGSLACTRALQSTLAAQRIPAQFRFTNPGTHSWPYWVDQLHFSWPVIARALNR
ncbi:putative mycolyltransferase [Gordonia effusa NBRC 100432]|uniref:Putative mycolyltransferase n=1 Tax=Gordonia effusa NBRC 100432 TaxID=1077974 RepID=H0R6Q0_9ACTN|nr:alpha/beta hydrolase family protein [Gordonia effusa]GAB20751.1 putative mycolyltransferase [Gordonia effusa NBRC 100432]